MEKERTHWIANRKREINSIGAESEREGKKRRDHMNPNGFIYKTKTAIKVLHYLTYSIAVFFFQLLFLLWKIVSMR